jgi:hypothetical protein
MKLKASETAAVLMHPADANADGDRAPAWVVALFYAVILAIALFPLFTTEILPLTDFPNHLARTHIVNNLASNATLQSYYAVHWDLLRDALSIQSTDFLLPPLAKPFGLFAAARIYVAVTFLLLAAGVAALHAALFGRLGLWPAASALFFYNLLLAWGFVSCLFAMGLALLMFAGWIATAGWPSLLRILLFSVATLILFFCHFFIFASYAVIVGVYELARVLQDPEASGTARIRALAMGATPFLVPLALAANSLAAAGGGTTFTLFGTIYNKIQAILSPIAMYMNALDIALAVVVLALWLFFKRTRSLRYSTRIRLPFQALLFFAIIMPTRLFDVWGADFRLPTFLLLMSIGGSTLKLQNRRQAACFAAGLVILMLVRIGFVVRYWDGYQADFQELRTALEQVDEGSRVMALMELHEHRENPPPNDFVYWQVFSLAVIDRDVFLPRQFTFNTPLSFTGKGLDIMTDRLAKLRPIEWKPKLPAYMKTDPQTVRQAERLGERLAAFDYFSSTADWSAWPEHFDYFINLDFGRSDNPVPTLLTPVAHGSYFTIYRIHAPNSK